MTNPCILIREGCKRALIRCPACGLERWLVWSGRYADPEQFSGLCLKCGHPGRPKRGLPDFVIAAQGKSVLVRCPECKRVKRLARETVLRPSYNPICQKHTQAVVKQIGRVIEAYGCTLVETGRRRTLDGWAVARCPKYFRCEHGALGDRDLCVDRIPSAWRGWTTI